jgi:hypothetical protein
VTFDGCMAIAKTVRYLRLADGSGTTLVEQMRPAPGLAMPMFAVPFARSEEWNEFRRRADERHSVVEPKLGAVRHSFRYPDFRPSLEQRPPSKTATPLLQIGRGRSPAAFALVSGIAVQEVRAGEDERDTASARRGDVEPVEGIEDLYPARRILNILTRRVALKCRALHSRLYKLSPIPPVEWRRGAIFPGGAA